MFHSVTKMFPYKVVLLLVVTLSFVSSDSCPDINAKGCGKKQIQCILPPKDGDSCPSLKCINKKYKSPTKPKKKCNAQCPLHCGDQLTCPLPLDNNVNVTKI